MGAPEDELARFASPELTLKQALHGFFLGFTEPLKQGDLPWQCMKLHFRELLEPTGLWEADPTFGIGEMHQALVAVLCRHLGLAGPDLEVQRLAICVAGLGVHLHVGHDINNLLAPGINEGDSQLDLWLQRLVDYALALVQVEQDRRAAMPAARSRGKAR